MALTHNRLKQPFLDNLNLPEMGLKITDVTLPSHSDIDPEKVEYIVDVDLDELIVFFGDKSTPYSYDESDDNYSLLINEQSDRIIGIVVNRFLTHAIKVYPELVPVLRHATVVAGEALERPYAPDSENRSSLRTRMKDWVSDKVHSEERKSIFADFANLVGIT